MAVAQLELAHLIPPAAVPSLTPPAIEKLADTYPASVAARADDIFALARLFTISLTEGSPSEQAQRWHHLLMAAGNFKRQGGSIRIGPLIQAPVDVSPPVSFVPPDAPPGSVPLAATSGHEYFKSIKGLRRVPTSSVVLAALWPDENLITDRRDLNAAVGLLLPTAVGSPNLVDDLRAWSRSRRRMGIVTSDYAWLKGVAMATLQQPDFSGVSLLILERALFRLDMRTPRTPQTSWPEYSIELGRQAELCPGCHVLRRAAHATGCTNSQGATSVW